MLMLSSQWFEKLENSFFVRVFCFFFLQGETQVTHSTKKESWE